MKIMIIIIMSRIYATRFGFDLLDSTSFLISSSWLVGTTVEATKFSFFKYFYITVIVYQIFTWMK